MLIVGPGNERMWCITNPNWQIKTDSDMQILEKTGHPMIDACHTYDIMVKNVAKNDAYQMLDTPHNELHMVTLMVASCKLLSLFSAIISMDTLLPANAVAGTSRMEHVANAVGDDSHMAVPAAREGLPAYAPWEERPIIPDNIPTGPELLAFLSLKAGRSKVP